MRRFSIVTLATALVLLSGCNKENDNSVDVDIDVENASDVRLIRLGGGVNASPVRSRASIESLEDMDGQMGIFCLAGRKTDVKSAESAPGINWMTAVSSDMERYGSTTNGRYWSNVCCEVKSEGGIYSISPTADQTCYRYYPTTSLYGYDFYGYHPYQTENRCTYTADSICVDMDIWGNQDIIYGRSEKIDDAYAARLTSDPALQKTLVASHYSARFFRKHPQLVDDAHMKLEHKLAHLRFFVCLAPDREAETPKKYDMGKMLHVQEIKINNVETKLRLVVADKSGKNRNGALYARSSDRQDVYLRNRDGVLLGDAAPIELTTSVVDGVEVPDTIQLGDGIMLLPGKSIYYMSATLADKDGNVYPSETDIAISLKNSGKKFEAGKIYNVYMQVSGVKNIGITAELADWEESGEEMDIVEFN